MKTFPRAAGRIPRAFRLCFVLLPLLSALVSPAARAQQSAKIKIDPEARQNYEAFAREVQPSRLQSDINRLAGISYPIPESGGAVANSRMAGTPGGDQARDYVEAQFKAIFGAGNVRREDFDVTIPMDRGAFVSGAGIGTLPLRPLWPNLVRTSTLSARGVDGPLIYAGQGNLRAFRGKKVEGSIVLLDFNCGTQWLNAPRLGAKAVIFVEPTQTMRGEAESKFIGIPVAIPRFWVSRGAAAALQTAALTKPNFRVHLQCNNPWETHKASNLVGTIPGSDPTLGKQIVVIESYYDSMSVVPSLAPGAESACGIAGLLELARLYKAHPPRRTVEFLACGAHFLGIQGFFNYINTDL